MKRQLVFEIETCRNRLIELWVTECYSIGDRVIDQTTKPCVRMSLDEVKKLITQLKRSVSKLERSRNKECVQ